MSVKCGHCKSYGQTIEHVKECSNPTARRVIKSLVSAEPLGIPTLAEKPVEGVFFKAAEYPEAGPDEGRYYKVVQSTNTGNWYAKEWMVGEGHLKDGWIYAGRGPLHFLTALDRVIAEQASLFGAVTGTCVFCGRKLTDERSIEVGYGPVCAGHNGLPWGEYTLDFSDPSHGDQYDEDFERQYRLENG